MAEIKINPKLCKQCGWCQLFCPKNVFGQRGNAINLDACLGCKKCGNCQLLCPDRAIHFDDQKPAPISDATPPQKYGGWTFGKSSLEPGSYFVSGNEACVLGAINAGCRFYAGYPITPASEIMHEMAKRLSQKPECAFIQMEDEIGSMAAVIGASKAGAKAMTATSGPGFSLMQESIGYAVMTDTPCVIIDVQRAGPSTGQATRPAGGDLMQAIWGCHGDSPKPVLVPTDAQDCYDLLIKAFNLSEQYLTPVILLSDETIAHLREKIEIPATLRIFNRTAPVIGDGQRLTVTGSTHYANGLRAASDPQAQQDTIDRFTEKMEKIGRHPIIDINCRPENEVVVISCGFTARGVAKAVHNLGLGNRIGTIVIKMVWPFPKKEIRAAVPPGAQVIVPEMNAGQLIHPVTEAILRDLILLRQTNGLPIEPKTIRKAIEACLRKVQQ